MIDPNADKPVLGLATHLAESWSGEHSPLQNRLLAALPVEALNRIGAGLELVHLEVRQALYEPGSQQLHVYFPISSVVSLHQVMESGQSVEAAGVGNDGMVGVALLLGTTSTSSSATVQTAGYAYRLERSLLKLEMDRGETLQRLMLRYTQGLVSQMFQTAVCNRYHATEQQLSRWILSTLDRSPPGELLITQESVARMLGVRRESVTEAAGRLQQAGWIRLRRGRIAVSDKAGLETCACECYALVKKELARLKLGPG